MEKNKEEFVFFIKQAVAERQSDAYIELYSFLQGCFTRADDKLEGKVSLENFDKMIEEAGALPRKHGFAPKTEDLYKSDQDRKNKRTAMFQEMNPSADGFITFEEWLQFALKHITSKVDGLSKSVLLGAGTKEEFIEFVKKAVDRSTSQYKEMYYFLLKCFVDADRDHDGLVNPKEFDAMIEIAAEAPRNFGLAPKTSEMFKNDAQRLSKRLEYFLKMDDNNDGTIQFDEWLDYAMEHIIGKVAALG